tara:strand:+ start:513 stop:2999 length:2487 start_codon:yes stop_codon:yes gene_type:complete
MIEMIKEVTKVMEIPGVGAATAEKLEEGGYDDLMSIAVASPSQITELTGVGEAAARKIIKAARDALSMGFESGVELLKKREQVLKITTGVKAFDEMLAGGFETGSISECFGEFGSSKCVSKDTPVYYYNNGKPCRETFEEMYNRNLDEFGEEEHEEGHVVKTPNIQVVGLNNNDLNRTDAPLIYREKVNRILEIKTQRGRTIKCTKQHKLLSFKSGCTWLHAGSLQEGDLIAYPRNIMAEGKSELSEDDAYFLGLFVAEGTKNPLSITNGSEVIKDWLVNYVENRFGYVPTVRFGSNAYIILFRKETKSFLGKLAETNAYTKFIPEKVFYSSEEVIRSFLAGYLDGDGTITKEENTREIINTTVSKQLSIDLGYLYMLLGIGASYHFRTNDSEGFYQLSIVGEDRVLLNGLPLKIKDIHSSPVNSWYGYGKDIIKYLRETYRNSLGGNRGRTEKELGRKNNSGQTFYHYFTHKSYEDKVMNEKTLLEVTKRFLVGKQKVEELIHTLLDENLSNKDFFEVYDSLPFAANMFCEKLGLSKSTVQNYRHRGIPKDNENFDIWRKEVIRELYTRKTLLETALVNIKNAAFLKWDSIVSIKEIDYNDYVYDFVVPNGHNFVAGNMPTIMHNSQIAHQLAVNIQLPKEQGGADGRAVFIDGENTFRPERIIQMATGRGLDPEKVLKNIKVARAFNSDHQMLLAEKVEEIIKEDPKIKLIVVDSLTSHFRADFHGRGMLADRQQKLNKHMHVLMRLASTYNLCVYVTNQVMAKPDTFFGDPTAAIGGNIVGHNSQTRIYLRKGKKGSRVGKLIDSPYLADGEAAFMVTEEGLKDL